ncbi:MAG: RluA family pseudouridine synthase [Syntrophaceae bacterium]|nr:RluA family pseudouridine synthase [Syntrophaceae bacterium]
MDGKIHTPRKHLSRGLEILYEDRDLLVIDKPAGLLTVGTKDHKIKTAEYILTDYVRKGVLKSRKRIFVVHRLDQWTSGVMLFAKTEEAMGLLKARWRDTEKKYIAVVHGHPAKREGVITSYLAEDKAYDVYSTTDAAKGRLARTAYKVMKETKRFSLLEIRLLTGRKNQIRVHLADEGHPIVGDRKYGKINDGYERLALHSQTISFKHPATGEPMTFESKVPNYFFKLIGNTQGCS